MKFVRSQRGGYFAMMAASLCGYGIIIFIILYKIINKKNDMIIIKEFNFNFNTNYSLASRS